MIDKTKFLNSKLNDVYGGVFFLDKENTTLFNKEDVINVLFCFDSLNIKIECDSNAIGIRITYNSEGLRDIDMGESGYIKVLSIAELLNLNSCIGMNLTDMSYIIANKNVVGLAIFFSKKESVFILNLGDQLFFFKDLPEDLKNEGYYMESFPKSM